VLWDERAVVLPGAITAFYDLFHGVPRMLEFQEEARKGDLLRVEEALPRIPAGTLTIGDRAFGVPRFFESLGKHGLFGLARRSKTVKLRRIEVLSRKETADTVLQDSIVEAGSGTNGVAPQRLRCIYLRRGKKVLRLLTNVLDPARLSAPEALALYRHRWKVERMFYDLKEVLNLHRFYAANANAVAMQVYAAPSAVPRSSTPASSSANHPGRSSPSTASPSPPSSWSRARADAASAATAAPGACTSPSTTSHDGGGGANLTAMCLSAPHPSSPR
jgi:hypothetical protein